MLNLFDILVGFALFIGFLILIFASKLLPEVIHDWLHRHRYTPEGEREARRRLGLCEKCGYDLRGSGESCPECGAGKPPE